MPYTKDGIGQAPKWVEPIKTIQIVQKNINCIELFRQLRPRFPHMGVRNVFEGCELIFKESKEAELRRNLVDILDD